MSVTTRWWRLRPRFRDSPERVFAFRLARDLGMTYADVRRRISAAEFTDWLGFYSYEHKMRAEAEREANRRERRR